MTQVAEVDSLTTAVNLMFLHSGVGYTLGDGGGKTGRFGCEWMDVAAAITFKHTYAILKNSANFKEETRKPNANREGK